MGGGGGGVATRDTAPYIFPRIHVRDRYTYICLEFMVNVVNVGKYTIHGLSGIYAYIYIII